MKLERLPGSLGNGGAIFREGDWVLRPTGAHSAATTTLLRALATTGFQAPVPLDPPHGDTQRFRWIEGDVGVPPFPDWVMSDEALTSATRLLRRYHGVARRLSLPEDLTWSTVGMSDPAGGSIICHNDVCPENVVFHDGQAVALLDFDFAAPGRPLWDLAQLARMWCPTRPADLVVAGMEGLDPFHRLRVIADAYGLDSGDRDVFVGVLEESCRVGMEFVRRRLGAGEPAFRAVWDPKGGATALNRILEWQLAHRERIRRALQSP